MRPLRTRLQEARKRLGIPREVLERDYLLSWVLAGIGQVDSLRERLVFKGGTALKKCYFGDYRFSEDLDFSALEGVPAGEAMERAVREACGAAARLLDEYVPVEIACERYTEPEPHPGDQEAFTIRACFPCHRQPQTRVMIETAVDEKILKPAPKRRIIHEYGEFLEAEVRVHLGVAGLVDGLVEDGEGGSTSLVFGWHTPLTGGSRRTARAFLGQFPGATGCDGAPLGTR